MGIATLTQVRHPRELPFAALPALFALHQFDEGFVWLSLEGHLSRRWGDVAAYAYVLYAQGVLPVLFPLALLLIEPVYPTQMGRRAIPHHGRGGGHLPVTTGHGWACSSSST